MEQLDIDRLRQETPGCQHVLHFNNAGAALQTQSVMDAVTSHLQLELTRGGYEAADLATAEIQKFYQHASSLINCKPEEIAFLENATRAWDMAFYSLQFKPGDKILTCMSEYGSNYLAFLHRCKKLNITLEIISNDSTGQLDIDDLRHRIDNHVKLIAITHVPTQGGLINPAEQVGKIAKEYQIPYLLDATQSVGQMPIDVQTLHCDFLCATGRKFLRGPRGTGFLFVKKAMLENCDPPFIDLRSATWVADNEYTLQNSALRFEGWEQNFAAKIGLSEAIHYALNLGLPSIWQRVQALSQNLRQQLLATDCIQLQDLGENQCGIVSFSSPYKSPQEIQQYLAAKSINVSVSRQEYARLDMVKRNLPAVVRSSVHYYNTDDEIDVFCNEVKSFLKT